MSSLHHISIRGGRGVVWEDGFVTSSFEETKAARGELSMWCGREASPSSCFSCRNVSDAMRDGPGMLTHRARVLPGIARRARCVYASMGPRDVRCGESSPQLSPWSLVTHWLPVTHRLGHLKRESWWRSATIMTGDE